MPNELTAIIGGGAWGTALAVHLARLGQRVGLWIREPEVVARMKGRRDNPAFLPGVLVPEAVTPSARIDDVVAGASLLLFVVPAQYAREVYREVAGSIDGATPVVVASKGIEEGSLALPLDVARQELQGERPLAVLSGPSFAAELAAQRPTAVVVASSDRSFARLLQDRFSSPLLRLYTNDDPIGVQLAGALKNVVAIAIGIADGLGTGENARAGLITRGLAEMARLGSRLGGKPATFSGLAGLGDLVLTCTGDLSRNRQVGRRLGRGERLIDILSGSRSVAEGVSTTRSAVELARRHDVDVPIIREVHRILFEEGSPADALQRLMSRPLIAEHPEDPTRAAR